MKLRISDGDGKASKEFSNWSYNVHELDKNSWLFQASAETVDGHYVLSKGYPLMGGASVVFGIAHSHEEADKRLYQEALNFASLKKGNEEREVIDDTMRNKKGKLEKELGADFSSDRGMPN
jgi:hypothetical protein